MAVFTNTVITSRYHRTIIRWLHDDIARALRSRVAFVRQSDSFLFLSYCLRESKNSRYQRWSYEVITMLSRFDKMPWRWPYEGKNGHTKTTRKWAFARTSINFLHTKDFAFAHEVAAEAWKIQPAVTSWIKMASRMARCFHVQTRICTFSYSCVNLLSNSGQCDAIMRSILAFSLALFAWFEFVQI